MTYIPGDTGMVNVEDGHRILQAIFPNSRTETVQPHAKPRAYVAVTGRRPLQSKLNRCPGCFYRYKSAYASC